ncbi:hypothetical protein ACWDBW_47020 [Streptomyces sp. NPDC001107]
MNAVRRSHRLGSRSLPHTGAVPAGAPPRSRRARGEARAGRAVDRAGREQEQMTDVATLEESRRVIEAAATQQPRAQPAPGPGTPTGGIR